MESNQISSLISKKAATGRPIRAKEINSVATEIKVKRKAFKRPEFITSYLNRPNTNSSKMGRTQEMFRMSRRKKCRRKAPDEKYVQYQL